MEECVFCKIVDGEEDAEIIWEDDDHLAFLSHRPNTEGATVVITKEHFSSYAFELQDDVLSELTLTCKEVGKLLDRAFKDVERTGMVFEGMGVNHVHAKLFPMHGTEGDWEAIESGERINVYFEEYPGYISSHDAEEADSERLAELAEKIRNS